MDEIELLYAQPAESLRDAITFFYQLRIPFDRFDDKAIRADLPQMLYVLTGTDGYYTYADGIRQALTACNLIGPSTSNAQTGGNGPILTFGMGILPAGWARLVSIDASALTNQVVGGEQIFGHSVHDDVAALTAAPDFPARVEIANAFMAKKLTNHGTKHDGFIRAVEEWLLSTLSPEIDALEAATGYSRKRLERLSNQIYGSPPKMLARKYRALRAATRIAKGETLPLDLLSEGFSDQSHLIREIKHFTGHTPMEIRDNPSALQSLMMQRTHYEGLSDLVTGT
jgi:AraC-like DNA-binding protein